MKQTTLKLTLLLVAMLCAVSQAFAYDCQVNGIYYNLNKTNNTAIVTSGGDIKYKGEVVIPKAISVNDVSYEVKAIEADAFSDCTELTAVTIGEAINSIEASAFSGCSGLVSVSFNAERCTRMGNETYPVFAECPNLTKLTIGEGVTLFPYYAFMNCAGLTSITFPESVTDIYRGAFANCTGLTSIYIPKTVNSVNSMAFAGCSKLESIVVDPENPNMDSRNNCNAIIGSDNVLWVGCKNTIIPNTVIAIFRYAFMGMTGLTSIRIPNSVETIWDYAFANCTGLTSISIPNSVQMISDTAFAGCTGLTSIHIPSSVTNIGGGAFSGVEKIEVDPENPKYDSRDNCNAIISTQDNKLVCGCKNTIIPNSVTAIGSAAFNGCIGLSSITIPNSVTSIDDSAFNGCTGLTSITIPSAVETIGGYAFKNCDGLASVAFNAENCVYGGQRQGNSVFDGCSSLTSLTFGEKVSKIPDYTFKGCTGLTSVTFPKSVTAIGLSAFDGCTELVKLVSLATTPPVCGEEAFKQVDKDVCELFVPKESISLYKIAEQWKDFTLISEYGGVENVSVDTHNAVYEVYNLQGIRMGSGMHEADITADVLPHGVYILVSPQGNKKVKI